MHNKERHADFFNNISQGHFPALLGIQIIEVEEGKIRGEMAIQKSFLAPNGYLHAGSVISFADTLAGYATVAHLPEKAKSFTTIELKSNFLGTKREGKLIADCSAEHLGRTTHIWRVIVRDEDTKKKLALFSCTQLIIY